MSEFKHNDSVWVKGFVSRVDHEYIWVSLIKGPTIQIGQTLPFDEKAIFHRTSNLPESKDPNKKDFVSQFDFMNKPAIEWKEGCGPMPWRLQIAASLISEYGEIDALRIADDLIKRHEETK